MSVFIQEGAILQEIQNVKHNYGKAKFKMVLQTVDEINQNRRLYPRQVLMDGLENCRSRCRSRSFFSELDHPLARIENDCIQQPNSKKKEF